MHLEKKMVPGICEKSGSIPFLLMSIWLGVMYFPIVTTTPDPSWSSNIDCIKPCSKNNQICKRKCHIWVWNHFILKKYCICFREDGDLPKSSITNKNSFAIIVQWRCNLGGKWWYSKMQNREQTYHDNKLRWAKYSQFHWHLQSDYLPESKLKHKNDYYCTIKRKLILYVMK